MSLLPFCLLPITTDIHGIPRSEIYEYVLLFFKPHGSPTIFVIAAYHTMPKLKTKSIYYCHGSVGHTWWWGSGLAVLSRAYCCICYQREMWVEAGLFRPHSSGYWLAACQMEQASLGSFTKRWWDPREQVEERMLPKTNPRTSTPLLFIHFLEQSNV